MGTVELPKKGKTARAQTKSAYTPKTGENRQDAPQPGPKGIEPEVRGSPHSALERIFREHSGRLINRLGARLPEESFRGLDEKVYDFISRNYKVIANSFPALYDEYDYLKKTPDKNKAIEITALLESDDGHFNRGEIEKSDRQWGISDLEAHTNNMLRRKTGIGSVVDSQKANSVAVCVFKDNAKKPKTVTDLRLAVNIPETELIDPESRFKARAAYLVKEIICRHLHENIEREINTEHNGSEDFLDRLMGEGPEINSRVLDEHLQKIDNHDEIETIRDKGFFAASNLIVSILNAVNLDCQFLENLKVKRELLIREYEDTDEELLPDEHYQIKLRYFSKTRLLEEREVYDRRLRSLSAETQRLWDLLEVIYQDSKSIFKVNDFEDLVRKNKNRINDLIKNRTGAGMSSFFESPKNIETPLDAPQGEKEKIRVLLAKTEERIKNISDSMYPVERQISEDKLSMLKNEFSRFEDGINPYNLQPGILLDIDLTSIKRKRTTLDSMALALGRFLESVPGCFREQ